MCVISFSQCVLVHFDVMLYLKYHLSRFIDLSFSITIKSTSTGVCICRIERWVSRERRPYLVRIPQVQRIQVVSNMSLKRPVISLILTIRTEKFLEQIFLIHSFKDVNAKMEFSSKLGLLHINGFVDLGSKFP